jgi:hypothetical protein
MSRSTMNAGDAAIARGGFGVREHDEQPRLGRVRDPQLAPDRRQPSPPRSARVSSANASLPERASESAYEPIVSLASRGRKRRF